MQLLKRLNHSYYIVNGFFMLSYILYHCEGYLNNEFADSKWDSIIYNFKSKGSIFLTLLALVVVKYLRSCSAEQFLRNYFDLAKVTIFARLLFIDPPQAILYFVLFMSMYLFLKQPRYLGKHTKMIPIRSVEQFNECVKNFAKKSKKRDESVLTFKNTNMQFVEFYRENEQLSKDTRALWAYFAEKYSTSKFKFYSVDVNKVKGIAEEYEINDAAESNEFPTVILFEEGTLNQRYPCEDSNTYLGKQLKAWKTKAFEKFFRFHNRWYDTKDIEEELKR